LYSISMFVGYWFSMQKGITRASMRIAHFIQRYPPAIGGSEAFFHRLSRYFAACGDTVGVFTTNALDLESLWSPRARHLSGGVAVEGGVEVHRYPIIYWPARRYLLKALSLLPIRKWQCMTLPCNPIAWRMWSESGHQEPSFDIVHASAFPYAWPIVCGLRLARRQRIPFVVTPFLHTGNPEDRSDRTRRQYLSPALVWLLHQASCIFVQTQLEREAILTTGIENDRVVLLGMGVAKEECTGGNRERARSEWQAGTEDVVIGHLGNNSEEKGTVDLLRAAELAWTKGASFQLVLAGPEMPNFRRFWDGYSSKTRVRRLGQLIEVQKRDFFAGIDVFALPSRSDSFGLVLLEAWANGVPNIAYRAGGVAQVLRNGVDGVLLRCGDLHGLASALGRLSEQPGLRRQLGLAGKERIEKEFLWEDKLQRVRAVYEKLTGVNNS
jgi:glycosyltransferase involved in cell wall biosynthesis